MGRALLRVHIVKCSGEFRFITAKEECEAILEKAFQIEPRLCYEGIGVYENDELVFKGRKFRESQQKLMMATEQIVACESWLVPQYRTKSVTRHRNSYTLKHIVEEELKTHVSNGAFCAMAIGLDWKYTVDGPNIFINIVKDLYHYTGGPVA